MSSPRARKKTLLMLIIIGGLFCVSVTFADEPTAGQKLAGKIVEVSNTIASLASRARVIPATIAGKLMTNSFVYGSAFHLDIYLFQFRHIIRTYTLYTLGFVFVGSLLRLWFKPNEAKSKIADLIKNTVIAGILISMSRGLIASLVDLSIIATSAVAAIPLQIYKDQRQQVAHCYAVPVTLPVKDKAIDTNALTTEENLQTIDLDKIVPGGDSVSGPLMFFGMGVLKFYEMEFIPQKNAGAVDRSPLVIISLIKILLVVMFLIPLIALMIVNMIRVVMLWLWIVFSPLIVLDNTFKGPLSTKFANYFGLKEIIALIFQPVAVVGLLGIGLILIIEMSKILMTCSDLKEMGTIGATPTNAGETAKIGSSENPINAEVDITSSLYGLGDYVGGLVGELILAFFVIFLLRALIKVGFSFSSITKSTTDTLFKTAEERGKALPILPGGFGVGAAQEAIKNKFGLGAGTQLKLARQSDRLNKAIFGEKSNQLTEVELNELQNTARTATSLPNLRNAVYEKSKTKVFTQNHVKKIFGEWITKGNGLNHIRSAGISLQTPNEYKTDISKLWADQTDSPKIHRLINTIFAGAYPATTPVSDTINSQGDTLRSTYGGTATK